MLAIVAFHVLPPLAFTFLHGSQRYRLYGIFVFTALCFVIGNLAENLSVLTGFPFGRYHFTEVMGPKLFHVPVLLGLAYVGMGYLSWTLGLIVAGERGNRLQGSRIVTLPLAAAFLMVAWDLSMDPIWSNFVHGWIWHEGGAYYGVPVSNFLGWYLTVYLIYQSFALYLLRSSNERSRLAIQPLANCCAVLWRLCCRKSVRHRSAGAHRNFRCRRNTLARERHPWRIGAGLIVRHGGLHPLGLGAAD